MFLALMIWMTGVATAAEPDRPARQPAASAPQSVSRASYLTASWPGQSPVSSANYLRLAGPSSAAESALVAGWSWTGTGTIDEPNSTATNQPFEPLRHDGQGEVASSHATPSAAGEWPLFAPPPPATVASGSESTLSSTGETRVSHGPASAAAADPFRPPWPAASVTATASHGSGPTWWGLSTTPPSPSAAQGLRGAQTWWGPAARSGESSLIDPVVHDCAARFGGEYFFSQPPPPPECGFPVPHRFAARFGWWGVTRDGDLTQVGEYQSVDPSPFFDLDGLWTDGMRTLDYYGSLLGADESQLGWRYLGPSRSWDFFFQDYPHRLFNDPLTGFTSFDEQPPNPLPPAPNNFRVMKEDLNVGQDYAIHVQELRSSFQGKLTHNLDWRLNVWSLRKYGQREANAMAHCYQAPNATDSNGNPVTGISCHVLSQGQQIDWRTAEVEPVIEGRFGPATVEYARTMRSFSQNDQVVTRPYDNFGFNGDLPYALVADNYTAIDRLRLGVNLTPHSTAYAYLFTGNTENQFRDTNRRFHGYDLRITDEPLPGVSVTGYAKQYIQTGQLPTTLLDLETADTIRAPINYNRWWGGIKGRWRPYRDDCSRRSGLTFSSGYEYLALDRENAIFSEEALTVDESSTIVNTLRFRTSMRWNPEWDTWVRYRLAFINDPLFGVPVANTATNSSLPTQEHLVELGTTWTPIDSFLISGSFGINNSWHSSDIADFDEDSYPIVVTAWYAPRRDGPFPEAWPSFPTGSIRILRWVPRATRSRYRLITQVAVTCSTLGPRTPEPIA